MDSKRTDAAALGFDHQHTHQDVLQPNKSSASPTRQYRWSTTLAVTLALFLAVISPLWLNQYSAVSELSPFSSLPHRYVICSPKDQVRRASREPLPASVYTGDEQRFSEHQGFTQCVGVNQGIIIHVGAEQQVLDSFCDKRSTSKAREADECVVRRLRRGQTLFPGFHDAHGHILDYGWSRTVANLVGSTSVQDVIQRLEDYVRSRPHLIAFALADASGVATNATAVPWIEGIGWDQTKWSPPIFPTAADLARSALLRRFPIILRRVDVHAVWLSEVGLDLVVRGAKGFPLSPDDDDKVEGGLVIRGQDRRPTGILIDNAMNFAYQVVPEWTDEERKTFYDAAAEGLLRVGITSVGDAATDLRAAAFYKMLDQEDLLRFRIYSMLACPPAERRCAHRIDQINPGHSTRGGKGMFTLRAVKLFNDGALGSWGSAMWEDYTDRPGERGLLLIPEQELPTLVEYWLERGWQVCTHAIGDRANTLTLDAYEQYFASHPRVQPGSLRPRIEHAQLMKPPDLTRFAPLGVIASMQPTHCTSDMGYVESRIGDTRASHGAYAWKSLLNANASLALGSDFPVELPDPLHGIYSSVTRLDAEGNSPHGTGGWFPHERLTRREALKGFTEHAAFAQFEEDVAGSISVGKRADFTLLDRNILDEVNVSPTMLRNAKVDATFVGGKVAFDRFAATALDTAQQEQASYRSRMFETAQGIARPILAPLATLALDPALRIWAALASGLVYLFFRSRDREPYQSLSCLALNVRPPVTAWMNMGFWTPQLVRTELDFPFACQTLAEQLYAAAGVAPGLKVLDVGCGAGESTLLLLDGFKPTVLHAVTSLHDEAAFASERLEKRLQEASKGGEAGTQVRVWAQDVLEWLKRGEGRGEQYDVILALDCAYHFSDRAEFIQLAAGRLNRGGRLAFVDLLSAYPAPGENLSSRIQLSRTPWPSEAPSLMHRLKHSFTCRLTSVKPANLWPVDRYFSTLVDESGFSAANIQMRDISTDVFPGFARFLRDFATDGGAWRGGGWAMRKGLAAFSNVVRGWGEEGGLVRCFIVVAQKE